MLNNPSSLYSGGQGILKDDVVNYVTALENKKRAKDEALDKYYRDLPLTINEKGVRDQDIPGLHEKIGELQQYWMQNRDAIKKGNTPQNFNYSKMWRDIRAGISMSQNETPRQTKMAQYKSDPKKRNMFKGAEREQMIIDSQYPVWDKRYKPLDLAKFDYIPPLDISKHQQQLARFKPNPLPVRLEQIPGEKYKKNEITDMSLSDQDAMGLYMLSKTQLDEDPSFAEHLKNFAKDNPDDLIKLNDLFQKTYKRPINPNSEDDIAAAYNLSQIDLTPKIRTIEDWGAKQDRLFRDRLDLFKRREAGKNERLKLLLDYDIDDVYGKLKDLPIKVMPYDSLAPGIGNDTLIDVTSLTDAQREDLLGKNTDARTKGYQYYKHAPIEMGGRVYVSLNKDGTVSGKDNVPIDPDQVTVNTFTRTGKFKKPLGKGELKITDIPARKVNQSDDNETLAEKMRRLKNKK